MFYKDNRSDVWERIASLCSTRIIDQKPKHIFAKNLAKNMFGRSTWKKWLRKNEVLWDMLVERPSFHVIIFRWQYILNFLEKARNNDFQ